MPPNIFIHSSSHVDPDAVIAEGTKIWHFCHIFGGARIGKDCKIGQNVVVHRSAVIGDRVKIQNNVSIYDGVMIEDDVFCGPSCVFTNVVNPRSAFPKDPAKEFQKTIVRKGATIGANATILCGIEIGRYAFIGAGAVVTKDVPDYALVFENPARLKGWMCECGEGINFVENQSRCQSCQRKYKKTKGRVIKVG